MTPLPTWGDACVADTWRAFLCTRHSITYSPAMSSQLACKIALLFYLLCKLESQDLNPYPIGSELLLPSHSAIREAHAVYCGAAQGDTWSSAKSCLECEHFW